MCLSGCLAFFVVVAFCAIMFHINRMVFGVPVQRRDCSDFALRRAFRAAASCKATLALAAIPLLVIGIYVPARCRDLLMAAASGHGRLKGSMTMLDRIEKSSRPARRALPDLCRARWKERVAATLDDRAADLPHRMPAGRFASKFASGSARPRFCIRHADRRRGRAADGRSLMSSTRTPTSPWVLCRCSRSTRARQRCRPSAAWSMGPRPTGTSARSRICSV